MNDKKCEVCGKDIRHGWYDREGGQDKYFHEHCKKQQMLNFFDEIVADQLEKGK